MSFKNVGSIKKKYLLSENHENEEVQNQIYKYQAIDKILTQIVELNSSSKNVKGVNKSEINSKIVGVYSPDAHELQLPFSMALSKSIGQSNVLFIDLEETSILPELIDVANGENMMDLLYEISTENDVELDKYIHQYMGFDYIEPFMNPNEITEIDEETWNAFFEKIKNLNYEYVVVLFGRTINGFSKVLENVRQLYVLGKAGDYYQKCQNKFLEYLNRIGYAGEMTKVILPMSATNLTEGTYCIGELLQGNLGLFVKKLLYSEVSDGRY